MNWEEKFAALCALTETSLKMREPGDWYVSASSRDVGGDGFLTGVYGNGRTPQEAVEDDWMQLAESLPSDRYIVLGGHRKSRKCVRWTGFMWVEVKEPKP
jgi:hypothetical protein